MSHRRLVEFLGLGDGRPGRRSRRAGRRPIRAGLESLEDRRLMTVTPGTVAGQGTILAGQDSFAVNAVAALVYGVTSDSGSLTYADARAHDSFVASTITSVQIYESPTVSGPTTTDGYFVITGTAALNGGSTAAYGFTATGSLPFPANAGSTGGLGFQATGPGGFSYNQPWHPWDKGETVAIALTAPVLVPTTTHLTSSANPSVYEQPVYFTATVTPGVATSSTVGGTVSFTVDSNAPVNEPVVNGKAVYATTRLGVGTHKVVASYLGTSLFAPSQDTIGSEVTNKAGSTTTLSYYGAFVPGFPLSLTAKVAVNAPSFGDPTGAVTFLDGTKVLGTVKLPGTATTETATLSLPGGLPVGTHSITAVYGGDANIFGSASAALVRTVAQVATTTTLTTSVNPVVVGNDVTLTAAVHASATFGSTGPRPTGTVEFFDGTTKIGSAPVTSAGVALLTTSFATPGYHALHAVYGGDTTFGGSAGSLTQAVASAPVTPHVGLAASANPAIVGQPVTFTVSVPGGATGMVALVDGQKTLGFATLVNGSATFTISSLALGKHTLVAAYGGDANFAPAKSSALAETVSLPVAGTIAGKGTTLSGQDSLALDVMAAIVGGVPVYSGSMIFADARAGDTFTSTAITSVQIYEFPLVPGRTATDSYFIVTGTAALKGVAGVFNFTLTVSLPFPANAGSTGGMAFAATGPNGFSYSTPWRPWDPGETIAITT